MRRNHGSHRMWGGGNSGTTDNGSGTQEAAPGDSGETAGGDKQTITITYHPGTVSKDDFVEKMLTQTYENWDKKDQVELKINKIDAADSDYLTKLQLLMQDASQCGDIVFEDTFQLTSDAAAGYLAKLDDFLPDFEKWNDGSSFIEATKAATYYNGSYYGIPCSTDSRGLAVNKDVLEAAGLGADWKPGSWAELLDGCRQIKKNCADVTPFWMTIGKANGEGASMNGYEMILYGTADGNDSLFDTKEEKWVVSSESIKNANQFVATLFDEGLTGDYSEMLDTGSDGYACDYLRQGKLGIYLTGSWFPANFQTGGSYEWPEFGDKLAFLPMPTEAGSGSITMSGGWAWSIPEKSANKEIAFEFLMEMMEQENYYIFIDANGNLPTIDMSEFPQLFEKPFMGDARNMLNEALFRPKNEYYSTVSTYIAQMSEDAATSLDAQGAMDTYKANVTGVVGEENTIEH